METRDDSEDKVQSVAEYAPEIIDQLFHDEGLYMPRVNYMVPRICFGKTCRCLEQISGVMVGNGGFIHKLYVNDGLRSVVWCFQPMRGMWSDDERSPNKIHRWMGGNVVDPFKDLLPMLLPLYLYHVPTFKFQDECIGRGFPGYLNKHLAKADTQYVAISPIAELGQ